ncbi:MAG: efflux RND transporter periplasmic adaptor subunit [Acidobacteriota bacterium]
MSKFFLNKLRLTLILSLILNLFFLSCSKKSKNKIEASGTIEAVEVTLSSKARGEILEIYVKEGDKVDVGDKIASTDKTELKLQLTEQLASLTIVEEQLKLIKKGAQKEDIRQAEESFHKAKIYLENAEDNLKRTKNLYEKESATSKQMEDAETQYKIAISQFKQTEEVLKKIKGGAREEEIKIAEARVNQTKAMINILRKKIEDCEITSPVKGFVTEKLVEKGELIEIGFPVVVITNLDKVFLKIYLSEINLGKVFLGQKAEIRIDSYPKKVFIGKVVNIAKEPEFTPKNIQTKEERVKLVYGIKIEIDNPEYILKPGMPADASLL